MRRALAGNEYILGQYGDSGTATDSNGVAARKVVLEYVAKAQASLTALSLDKTIPVGTSDAGAAATEELCAGVDYVSRTWARASSCAHADLPTSRLPCLQPYMANVHAWCVLSPLGAPDDVLALLLTLATPRCSRRFGSVDYSGASAWVFNFFKARATFFLRSLAELFVLPVDRLLTCARPTPSRSSTSTSAPRRPTTRALGISSHLLAHLAH